jgi:hypothetical protein
VDAVVPVNNNVLSVDAAVVELVKDRELSANDPLTSKVEVGDVVPIPICAYVTVAYTHSNNTQSFFICFKDFWIGD